MPGLPAPTNDERELLLRFLAQQRDALRNAVFGLTDEQAVTRSTVSELTVAALLRHALVGERGWIAMVEGGPSAGDQGFTLAEGDTVATLLDDYERAAEETEAVIRRVSLDDPVPVPQGVPWFPDDVDAWSVRWVLLHLIEEIARHAGHADIVREGIDGATCYPLMAAVEGWPETEWLKPWRPATPAGR
jgi:uncharacterized damage-inducible protein DinB